jgi:hypothetical protein
MIFVPTRATPLLVPSCRSLPRCCSGIS